jgi:hypothetical protein
MIFLVKRAKKGEKKGCFLEKQPFGVDVYMLYEAFG